MKHHLTLLLALSLGAACATSAPAEDQPAPLQGGVEETGIAPQSAPPPQVSEPIPVPVTATPKLQPQQGALDEQDPLRGSAQQDDLSAGADQFPLQPQKPRGDSQPLLKGFAAAEDGHLTGQDPDREDRELQIEWDKWRNKFLRTVLMSVQEKINNPDPEDYVRPRVDPRTGMLMPRFPLGTIAYFTVQVTKDGALKHLDIIETSGHPSYDKAVLAAIRELEGSALLNFPRGSRRALVQQEGGIKTATQGGYTERKFGDVERFREPSW